MLPYTQDYPAHIVLTNGIKDSFARQNQYAVKFSYEFLDLARFAHEADYLSDVARFFQEKYSRLKPDVVLTGATLSEFMLSYGKNIFPGVPIVFAWSENMTPLQAMPEGYYIVSGAVDYTENFRLILQARPSTKKIQVVVGDSEEERNLMDKISLAAEKFSGQVTFEFLNKLPYAQMMERVRALNEDSAILFVRWIKDASGKTFIPAQVVQTICRESKAPVYSVASHLLGYGVVGGYAYSFERLGVNIFARTMEIFEGIKFIPPVSSTPTSEYVFDWRQLKRWNINEKTLPEGSRIAFKELSVWDQHRTYILGGIALVLLEAALIVGLAVNRARRKRVELELVGLNASLEEMVASRTSQLQETNAELEQAKRTLEDMNARLEVASRTDSLTGLFNRRHLEESAPQEHARYVRTGKRFSIVLCDIDFFKSVNDLHGHEAGDNLLRMIGQDIARAVRPYDILVRWGGEEFLLFLPSTEPDLAAAIAERICLGIRQRVYAYEGHSLRLSATLGVATVQNGESVSEVIRRADAALYEGKRSGRNRVVAS